MEIRAMRPIDLDDLQNFQIQDTTQNTTQNTTQPSISQTIHHILTVSSMSNKEKLHQVAQQNNLSDIDFYHYLAKHPRMENEMPPEIFDKIIKKNHPTMKFKSKEDYMKEAARMWDAVHERWPSGCYDWQTKTFSLNSDEKQWIHEEFKTLYEEAWVLTLLIQTMKITREEILDLLHPLVPLHNTDYSRLYDPENLSFDRMKILQRRLNEKE